MHNLFEQSKINYRVMSREEDYANSFFEMSQESFEHGSPWTVDQFKGTFQSEHVFYIIAWYNEEIVGFLGATFVADEAEIYTIVVSPKCKHQGVGMGLLNELKRMMRINRVSRLLLEVRTSNHAAILFYKRVGFQPIGARSKYYSNPIEDAVVLELVLNEEKRDTEGGESG